MAVVAAGDGPEVWLLRDEAKLAAWVARECAEESLWLEGRDTGRHPFAPWIEIAEGDHSGKHVAARLASGPIGPDDPDDPVLPDPFGAFACVAEWLEQLASQRRVNVVLRGAARYGRDSLDLLVFVTRYLGQVPICLLLTASGTRASPTWVSTLGVLRDEIGVHGDVVGELWEPASKTPPRGERASAVSYCRAGAVQAGAALLATTLSDADDAPSWQTLAMVGVWLQQDEIVESAVANILVLDIPWRQKARAVRTWMLALRRAQRVEDLRVLVGVLSAGDGGPDDVVPAAWMYLDRALASTAMPDPAEHVAHLDRLLAIPEAEIPRQCQATALVWRSAAHYMNGELHHVLELLSPAIGLMEELGDFSRTQHVRARYGVALAVSGEPEAACAPLARATREAVALGQYDLAAICATEHATASLRSGHDVDPRSASGLGGWKAAKVWASSAGVSLSVVVAARAALAEARLDEAVDLTEHVLAEAARADETIAGGRMRLLCEGAFLQADIAEARDEDGDRWIRAARRLAEQAPAEEQPLLRIRGAARRRRGS